MAMTMRERIRRTRTDYGLSLEQVGKELGVTKNYLSQIENNKVVATDDKLLEILNAVYKVGERERKKQDELTTIDKVINYIQENRRYIDKERFLERLQEVWKLK